MSQREDFIKAAQAEIGTTEEPPDSNKTKYGKFTGHDGQPWCGSFVMWCASQVKLKIPNVVSTMAGVSGFQGTGKWQNPATATPAPGDLAFFDFPGGKKTDHVGIVIKDNGDGTVTTVEGNTSDAGSQNNGGAVLQKIRAYRANNKKKLPVFIMGFGKPTFKD